MAVLKLEGLRMLACLIAEAVPGLNDRICTDQATPAHRLELPSLAIEVTRSRYMPDQEDEHHTPSANSLVLNVGRHVQDIKMTLGHTSAYERAAWEQKILDLFLETEGHPGVLFTDVMSCTELGDFVASWELEDEDWRNERAFDRQLYSEIRVTGILPALVTRRGVYTIEQLQLGLEIGPTVDITQPPPAFDSTTVVQINEDGTFTPL